MVSGVAGFIEGDLITGDNQADGAYLAVSNVMAITLTTAFPHIKGNPLLGPPAALPTRGPRRSLSGWQWRR